MNAREEILAKLKAASAENVESEAYTPRVGRDLGAEFLVKAKAADAIVHEITSTHDLPAILQSVIAANGDGVPLHIASGSFLRELPWTRAPKLCLSDAAPDSGAIALSAAEFAIAESGTLAFFSGPAQPSTWHFLPEIECVLVGRATIVPTLEDMFSKLADRSLPSTLNLVTGPSRTADIEQTIERGAHGPRDLHIFLSAG